MGVKYSLQMMLVMVLFIKQAVAQNTSRSLALPGCQERCGDLLVPYPFGIGPNCSALESTEIYCNSSFNQSKPFIRTFTAYPSGDGEYYLNDTTFYQLEVLEISLEAGTIRVNHPITRDCMGNGASNRSPYIVLRRPMSYSNTKNRFTAMACDSLALLYTTVNDTIRSGGCLSICNPSQVNDNGCLGTNCCQVNFSPSRHFMVPYFPNYTSTACREGPRYAFIVDLKWFEDLEEIYSVKNRETVPAVLNWRTYNTTCQSFLYDGLPSPNGTLCGTNALCTNESLCTCKKGYEGNPYLQDGCQDIDECANATTNRCQHNCINTPGSYNCSCKKGYQVNPYLQHRCQDINECANATTNSCDQICTNKQGSYNCSCIHGYVLVGNSKCRKVDDHSDKKVVIIVIASCSGLGFLLVSAWWLYKVIRRRRIRKLKEKFFKKNGGLLLQQQVSSSQGNMETTKLFASKELEKATDLYNVDRIVGQGGQGSVYKGMLTDGRIVAVKKSKIDDESKIEHFINEVVILSQINHRNIVKLYGCCLETHVPLLVYEFIPNGTLMQYIHEHNEYFPLTWDVRVRVATEVARALYYLHSIASIPIYHRDIKSSNILLDDKYTAKVADFGTSRSISIEQTHLTTRVQGTFGYLDPEYLQSSQFTDKSDVYSFGVVLVELLTGQKPILATQLGSEARSLVTLFLLAMEENRVLDILDSRITDEDEKEEKIAFANIAYRCLNLNGRKRPTMKQVVTELESIRSTHASPACQQHYEEVEYKINELNGPWESDVTSSSMNSTGYNSLNIDVQPLMTK